MERMAAPLVDSVDQLIQAKETNLGPLAVRLLKICQDFHDSHHLIVDVKSDNFMLATTTTATSGKNTVPLAEQLAQRVRYLDLGHVTKYVEITTGNHNEPTNAPFKGTPLYSSLHVDTGMTPSRRDDVFSVALVLAELIIRHTAKVNGTFQTYQAGPVPSYLPWATEQSDRAIGESKRKHVLTRHSEFYARMPEQAATVIYKVLQAANEINFKEKPDYDDFASKLQGLTLVTQSRKKTAVDGAKKVAAVTKPTSAGRALQRAAGAQPTSARSAATAAAAAAVGTSDASPVPRRSPRHHPDPPTSHADALTLTTRNKRTKATDRTVAVKNPPATGRETKRTRPTSRGRLDDEPEPEEDDEKPPLKNFKVSREEEVDDDVPMEDAFVEEEGENDYAEGGGVERMDVDEVSDGGDSLDSALQMGGNVKIATATATSGKKAKVDQRIGARLVITNGPQKGGDLIMVQGVNDVVVVGKKPKASNRTAVWQIQQDDGISNNHVKLELKTLNGNARVQVTALDSSVDTYCKGRKLGHGKSTSVFHGEVVRIGNTSFSVQKWTTPPIEKSGVKSALKSTSGRDQTAAVATAAVAKNGKVALIRVQGGPHAGKEWVFDASQPQKICIGSEPAGRGYSGTITLGDDENIGKNHVQLHIVSDKSNLKVTVTDLKTPSGTLVKGITVPKGKSLGVGRGDPIQLGDTTLVVV